MTEATEVWASPPDLTVSQWADEFRYLSSEASAEPGRWRTDRAEYIREIMDVVSDPRVEVIVLMASAQVGKTELLLNIIGYLIDQDPSPVLLMQPTLEMAQAFSKDRLAPMVRDTPALLGKIKDPRARDSGNTMLHKSFAGGHITLVGANSPSGLASRPIRVVLADEIDRYPVSAGTEGDPFLLAKKRTTTFYDRKVIVVSTPTIKGESRIEELFEESDQRYRLCKCPHCDHEQRLVWAQVHWEKDEDQHKPETARYTCLGCGVLWSDAERWQAIRAGRWEATKEFQGVAGFHLSELYSSWVRVSETASAFLSAKRGGPEALQVWTNTALGETWEERGEKVDDAGLIARREAYAAPVPDGVLALTVGVDVQDNRFEVEVVGWGADDESWSIEYRVIAGDPSTADPWTQLDAFLMSQFPTAEGGALAISAVCLDSGGHHTQAVYDFCRARIGRRVWAIKGGSSSGGDRKPIWPKSATVQSRGTLYVLGVDAAKDRIAGHLAIDQPGPGYCHFPADRDARWFEGLTVESSVTRYRHGRPYRVWRCPKGARNEPLDCRVYAMAALEGLKSMFGVSLSSATAPSPPPKKPQSSSRSKKGSWMKRRR